MSKKLFKIKHIEIIVIDDGSKDDTYKIVEELAKGDNRIKLYRNDTNLQIVKTVLYLCQVVNISLEWMVMIFLYLIE